MRYPYNLDSPGDVVRFSELYDLLESEFPWVPRETRVAALGRVPARGIARLLWLYAREWTEREHRRRRGLPYPRRLMLTPARIEALSRISVPRSLDAAENFLAGEVGYHPQRVVSLFGRIGRALDPPIEAASPAEIRRNAAAWRARIAELRRLLT